MYFVHNTYNVQPQTVMATAPMPPSREEGPIIERRTTQGGRHIWYSLDVIQQPERARACGSGPKCTRSCPGEAP